MDERSFEKILNEGSWLDDGPDASTTFEISADNRPRTVRATHIAMDDNEPVVIGEVEFHEVRTVFREVIPGSGIGWPRIEWKFGVKDSQKNAAARVAANRRKASKQESSFEMLACEERDDDDGSSMEIAARVRRRRFDPADRFVVATTSAADNWCHALRIKHVVKDKDRRLKAIEPILDAYRTKAKSELEVLSKTLKTLAESSLPLDESEITRLWEEHGPVHHLARFIEELDGHWKEGLGQPKFRTDDQRAAFAAKEFGGRFLEFDFWETRNEVETAALPSMLFPSAFSGIDGSRKKSKVPKDLTLVYAVVEDYERCLQSLSSMNDLREMILRHPTLGCRLGGGSDAATIAVDIETNWLVACRTALAGPNELSDLRPVVRADGKTVYPLRQVVQKHFERLVDNSGKKES